MHGTTHGMQRTGTGTNSSVSDSIADSQKTDFSVVNFNCFGFKSSFSSILNIMKNNDCMFICETWVKPNELGYLSKTLHDEGYWCHLKSSIDPEETLTGRPYGGVGFICRRKSGLTYIVLPCENERIMAMQLVTDGKVCLTIIGAYLPYHDGSSRQTELYCETLEDIQCIIDTNDPSPVLLLGDMNCAMPIGNKLNKLWYKSHPFTKHSYLLYNFMCHNDLYSCNFDFDQDVDYTFYKNDVSSYIDHVFFSKFASENVSNCKILCMPDNVSDHLPIRTDIVLNVNVPSDCSIPKTMGVAYPRIDWSDTRQRQSFSKHAAEAAKMLPNIDIDNIQNQKSARTQIDNLCDSLKDVIHGSAQKVIDDKHGSYKGKHQKRHWWNGDCLFYRDKQRFWFSLWKAAGRPRTGQVFTCYKLSKKSFRKACKIAMNGSIGYTYRQLDYLKGHRNLNKFWNMVRRSKCTSGSTVNDISMDSLHSYYAEKFRYDNNNASETVRKADLKVQHQYRNVKHHVERDFVMSESMLLTYMKRLRMGCASGVDGISAEHLKWAENTKIITTICQIITLCVRFGIVGKSFTEGLLIPLLKKPHIDPSMAKNYRPIVISTTFSKLLEIHILQMCGEHEFHDLQFGFISNRNTAMAAALTSDVIDHCVSNGSAVYVCALDAEGAFDGIPHSIMFSKAIGIVPILYWRILIYWYSRLTVKVKWGRNISHPIQIEKGTRQGGLSSPFIFNILYQDMVKSLADMNCGIRIGTATYNVCCYADDVLLSSLTMSGLQRLIDFANSYIVQHGLSFNPNKTTCVTFGKTSLQRQEWYLGNIKLTEAEQVKHLGVILCNNNKSHIEDRIQSARRAFYSLQGAGLCVGGCSPGTISHVFSVAVRPVLTYGIESTYQDKSVFKQIDSFQGKLVKSALGLKKSCKTTPLLQAIGIDNISVTAEVNRLSLFKSMVLSTSRCGVFYQHMLSNVVNGKLSSHKNTISSVLQTCRKHNISIIQYLCDESYQLKCKNVIRYRPECGVADSVKYTLNTNFNITTVNDLLRSY